MLNKLLRALRDQRGFTLVEVTVMMTVTVIGVVGTLAVATLAVDVSDDNEQKVVATNLAREGIELVRAIRDSNWAAKAQLGQECWDYYPVSQAQAQGLTASGYTTTCSQRWSADADTHYYAVNPNILNGMPWLTPVTSGTVEQSANLVCPNSIVVYVPTPGSSCDAGEQPFYRRVAIARSKDLGNDPDGGGQKYSVYVISSVTWPGKDGGPIHIEEHLTDWRKF